LVENCFCDWCLPFGYLGLGSWTLYNGEKKGRKQIRENERSICNVWGLFHSPLHCSYLLKWIVNKEGKVSVQENGSLFR
jgi:hypothetical protein